ncbi:hypothetical protein BKA61DRAFT_607705 [Leptodontidium sp. MPI-SDFR-AT-0119]|nr:hypothetical protein BKA61DRAFT_607705 [Leptodontidium sp. MPI-SDFR-AT-0119]
MGLVTNILGVIVGFAGLGACSLLRKLIIYNWPTSKIGKFLAFSPPVTVELSGYAAELVLLRRLVMAEEGRLGIEEPGQGDRRPGASEALVPRRSTNDESALLCSVDD